MSKDTLFTNENQAASGAVDYVKDVFADITLPATSNSGLTSSATTNPLGAFFQNDDGPRFEAKILYVKDLVLISDRTKWINNKPTYQVVWHENYPGAVGYVYGNVQLYSKQGQAYVNFKTANDGFGVTGVLQRAAFLLQNSSAATATARVVTDGVDGNTITFQNQATDADNSVLPKFSPYVHSASNETKGLHDICLVSNQANTLNVMGVIVLHDTSQSTVEANPGTSYVNKSKVTSTVGTTFSVASFGSTLGGKALIYKTASSGYAQDAMSVTTQITTGVGSSGTNLVAVSTGHGASFSNGYGIMAYQGNTVYIGQVTNISTDTLTVSPTLPFGLSNTLYRTTLNGPTYSINASLMRFAYSIDFSKQQAFAFTAPIVDPKGNYGAWAQNAGYTTVDGVPALAFGAANGFLQVEGQFTAAEIELIGSGRFACTVSINGIRAWSAAEGATGALRKTIFTDGVGFNCFNFAPGTSFNLGIAKINLYERNRNMGISYGMLAEYEQYPPFGDRGAINATLMAVGTAKRLYADQLFLQGSWVKGFTSTVPGGVFYAGSSTNSVLRVEYYGKNFGIVGTVGGGTLALDGSGIGLTFNSMHTVASEGFHTVQYTVGSGSTAIIGAFDFARARGEIKNLQNMNGLLPGTGYKSSPSLTNNSLSYVAATTGNGNGSTYTWVRRFAVIQEQVGGAVTAIQSSVYGDSFVINESGYYSINYTDGSAASAGILVITVNLTDFTSNPSTITYAQGARSSAVCGSSSFGTASFSGYLKAGDVVRMISDGAITQTSAKVMVAITKLV